MIKLIFDDVNKLAKFRSCKLYISEFTVFVKVSIDNLNELSNPILSKIRKLDKKNKLKKVGLKKIIETIVNQSWLSPKKETPKFLTKLLVSTNFYELEYMNDSFLVDSFNKIYGE